MNAGQTRIQLTKDIPAHVFFVTSRGYAGDHWYSWFVKALNCHPEVLAYLANEGSRAKYFQERSRSERPDLITYARFLADVGMTYGAIGDCYSYRGNSVLKLQEYLGAAIPLLNIVRHPYVWLYFYVKWRVENMRMPLDQTSAIEHEWSIAQHELFCDLGLRAYTFADVDIWATYQGIYHLNYIVEDLVPGLKQVRLEDLVESREALQDAIGHLSHNRLRFSEAHLSEIYSWCWKPFDGESVERVISHEQLSSFPAWKIDAFEKLHTSEARKAFQSLGYDY